MFIDSLCTLSNAQALSASAAASDCFDTNSKDIYKGEPLGVLFTVDVAADVANNDETYSFAVVTDTTTTITPDNVLATVAVARATLVAGYKFVIPIPSIKYDRYLGVYYTLGGSTPSITVTAVIQPLNMIADFVANADGFSIA